MAFFPLETQTIKRAVEAYVVPLVMLWFAGRWFFPHNPSAGSEWLLCAYMALMLGYLVSSLVKELK
jgi:hypothetical protein